MIKYVVLNATQFKPPTCNFRGFDIGPDKYAWKQAFIRYYGNNCYVKYSVNVSEKVSKDGYSNFFKEKSPIK